MHRNQTTRGADEGNMRNKTLADLPMWKRALDIALVVLALPALLPIWAIIALWVKLSSRGPVLFRQERVGVHGSRFTCFKFRSMKVGVDTSIHQDYLAQLMQSGRPMTKLDNKGDSRLIPLGALIRSTGLDELPQLLNVIRGEMSLVGPRPCLPYEYENFRPWQKRRCETVPGLTGLWQVSGKNRTTFNEMIRLDIAYVENQSLGLDLRIIFQTVPALVTQASDTFLSRIARPAVPDSGSSVPAGG
jgi:lipopolysaccharide/colanic/teichoic acid biosynthesis glycosyltransferase